MSYLKQLQLDIDSSCELAEFNSISSMIKLKELFFNNYQKINPNQLVNEHFQAFNCQNNAFFSIQLKSDIDNSGKIHIAINISKFEIDSTDKLAEFNTTSSSITSKHLGF